MSKPFDMEAIRKRCEAATEGPWEARKIDRTGTLSVCRHADFRPHWVAHTIGSDEGGHFSRAQANANCTFIAHARTDLPAALDEIERLRAALRAVSDEVERCERRGAPLPIGAGVVSQVRTALGVERKDET